MKRMGKVSFIAVLFLGMIAWAENKIIPSGTELEVRTAEAIDSKTAREGETFSAVMDRDIRDSSGTVLIPKGSETQLVLRSLSSGGTVGSSQMVLDLYSVTIGGQQYWPVAAGSVQSGKEGIGKNRRTAEMVGGGALLGTVIGAISGGKKGAVIGAIAGAAGGAAVQVLTRGKEVKVPAETVLTFRLDQDLQLEQRS